MIRLIKQTSELVGQAIIQ